MELNSYICTYVCMHVTDQNVGIIVNIYTLPLHIYLCTCLVCKCVAYSMNVVVLNFTAVRTICMYTCTRIA